MDKVVIIAGHGQGPRSFDPGACGNGFTESSFLRQYFIPAMKKVAPSHFEFITDYDVYAHQAIHRFKGKIVVELHLDAVSNPTVSGGHIIINKAYQPDAIDTRLSQVVKKFAGWRGKGIDGRSDLYNCNMSARLGINYRLVELGFITNKKQMQDLVANCHAYAQAIVAAIIGQALPERVQLPLGVNAEALTQPKFKADKTNPVVKQYQIPKTLTVQAWTNGEAYGANRIWYQLLDLSWIWSGYFNFDTLLTRNIPNFS